MTLIGYDLQAENRLGLEDGSIDCIISQRNVVVGKIRLLNTAKGKDAQAFL